MSGYHFAYAFERFPTLTQTFCVREVAELRRIGVRPLVFSIRDSRGEDHSDEARELLGDVHFLPAPDDLVETVKRWKDERLLPQEVVLTLRHWGERGDKMRVYEAAYIGEMMRRAGVAHVHTHFAGIGARTCWWARYFFGHTFSFTGHANDMFCRSEDIDVRIGLDALVRDAACVVTVSDFTAEWLRGRFPRSRRKVQRVYNGLDLKPFEAVAAARRARSAASPSTGEGIRILSVGRLIEKKGFPILIDACAELGRRGRVFECEIVGDGPLEGELRERIAAQGLETRVRLSGPMPFDDVLMLLQRADLFVLACQRESGGGMDNLPTVLMEAMAAELPCISTRLAGIPEMVLDGQTGILVEEGDVNALAHAVLSLAGDPGLRRRMGAAGAVRAREEFSIGRTALRLLDCMAGFGDMQLRDELAELRPDLRPALRRGVGRRLLRQLSFGQRRGDPRVVPEVPKGARS